MLHFRSHATAKSVLEKVSKGVSKRRFRTGKFLSTDPCRLAELELAFHRIRRVHTMAAFYNAIPKDSQLKAASLPCPTCGGTMFDASGPLSPIKNFTALGIRDLELWRREVGRLRVLASPT